jgi:hypothetical protein
MGPTEVEGVVEGLLEQVFLTPTTQIGSRGSCRGVAGDAKAMSINKV